MTSSSSNLNVIILGMAPSTKVGGFKNSTRDRLRVWCDRVGLDEFDFHNVIPGITNGSTIDQVDVEQLLEKTKDRTKVIALGGFVSRVCHKYGVTHYKIDHPSPRNRNLNDPTYEVGMLDNLRKYLND